MAKTRPRRLLTIEAIRFRGNKRAKSSYLKGLIPIHRGDLLSPDDPKLLQARLKLLSSGLFISVELSFKKGSVRGNVFLLVTVEERGTLLIKHLFGGTSKIIPFWAGVGVEERNFLGRGLALGLSTVGTARPEIMRGRSQFAGDAYMIFPTTFRLPLAVATHFNRGSEFYRTYGENDSGDPSNFLSMHYLSYGFNIKTWFPLGGLFLHVGLDTNIVHTDLPDEAVRHLPNGTTKNINFGLRDEFSSISAYYLKLVYDSRNRPVLPSKGSLFECRVRLGSPFSGSHYTFFKGEVSANKFISWKKHVLSFHFYGASMMGNLPLFEMIYIGDIQDLIPQRALGLNLSVAPSPNILGTGVSEMRWGTAAAKTTVRYDYTFYQGTNFVYRGNLFISGGVIMLSTATRLRYREGDLWDSAPVDLTFNFGVHLDTRVGIFRFSFSNLVGRLPL